MRSIFKHTLNSAILVLSLTLVQADAQKHSRRIGRDTAYIRVPERVWSLRLHETNKFFTTTFHSSLDSVPNARFKPNENPGIGIAVFRRSLGLWLAVNLPSSAEEERLKGARQHYDFQFNGYGMQYGVDAYLQYFRGFYLQNTREFRITEPDLPYIQRPDLNSLTFGLNIYRVFNWKRYSIRSAFIQSEIQRKSAGSFILGGGYSRHSFAADSAILPAGIRSPLAEESFEEGRFHALTISPGYMYTFVYKENWYCNTSATFGLGGVYRVYKLEDQSQFASIKGMWRAQFKMAFGYNSDYYFAGVSGIVDAYNLNLSKADLQYRWGNVRLFVGFRPDW